MKFEVCATCVYIITYLKSIVSSHYKEMVAGDLAVATCETNVPIITRYVNDVFFQECNVVLF